LADIVTCPVCQTKVDTFRTPECPACAPKPPVNVNPLPAHMHSLVEPYIRWREDAAVARFVLEQAERIGNGA